MSDLAKKSTNIELYTLSICIILLLLVASYYHYYHNYVSKYISSNGIIVNKLNNNNNTCTYTVSYNSNDQTYQSILISNDTAFGIGQKINIVYSIIDPRIIMPFVPHSDKINYILIGIIMVIITLVLFSSYSNYYYAVNKI
jgi:type II secretory pathway component PulC